MVACSPTFRELTSTILDMTAGSVFVAHNVGFDYKFLKESFKRLGIEFKRPKLCTVKYTRLYIGSHRKGKENMGEFSTPADAIAALKNKISQYGLCPVLSGIDNETCEGKNCAGACQGKESSDSFLNPFQELQDGARIIRQFLPKMKSAHIVPY